MPLLQVSDLYVSYHASDRDQPAAVNHLSFSLAAGDIVGLTGPSGCGKSTTALAILGLLPPQCRIAGSIRFDGEELTQFSERRWQGIRGTGLSLVLQEPGAALMPVMRVGAQIAEIARAHLGCDRRAARARALATMREVGLTEETDRIYEAYPHQLSGGQQQRILLAQALVCRPRLVIADEPTASLDPDVRADILRLIADLNIRFGITFLLISHSAEVLACAPRVLRMETGTLLPDHAGPPRTPSFGASPLDAARTFRVREDVPVLEARHVSKTYRQDRWLSRRGREVHALSSVSLRVPRGATIGLAGASGSGKSTLARCLASLERVDRGEVRIAGSDVTALGGRALRPYRNVVQLVFQDSVAALNPRFTAAETIAEPLVIQRIGTREDQRRRVDDLLAQVGLSSTRARSRVTEFSGGERQRLAIARAMALSPAALIFDEAFSGVDAAQRSRILNVLTALQDTYGLAYLFISHDLELLTELTPEIVVLDRGRVIDGVPSRVRSTPIVRAAEPGLRTEAAW